MIRLWERTRQRRCGTLPRGDDGWAWLGTGPAISRRDLASALISAEQAGLKPVEERLAAGASVERHTAFSSDDKRLLMGRLRAFAERHEASAHVLEGLSLALDELFSNAVYDAPVDRAGAPLQAHLSRRQRVESDRPVEVLFICDGDELSVTVRDRYGSLPRRRLVERLRACCQPSGAQIEPKQGGAGLGLFFVLENASRLTLLVRKGESTEVTVTRRKEPRRVFKRSSPTVLISFE